MADVVVNTTLMNTKTKLVTSSYYTSDGTGGTDVVLVDKSTFTGPNGLEPGRLVIERIEYDVDGMQMIVEFDHSTDDAVGVCVGQGFFDYSRKGKYQGFIDPASAGGTGDIVVTTVGHTSGDKGTIVLYMKKKD